MYKISKEVDSYETINLVFDDVEKACEEFDYLRYDEYIKFRKVHKDEFGSRILETKVGEKLMYKEHKLSTDSSYTIISLMYTEN